MKRIILLLILLYSVTSSSGLVHAESTVDGFAGLPWGSTASSQAITPIFILTAKMTLWLGAGSLYAVLPTVVVPA